MNQIVTKNIVPIAEINRFEDFIQAPAVRERIAAVLPQHLNPERMMRTVALAAYKTPKLREVHMMSLLGAVMTCASMGFEPNTPLGHAYLIPFEKKKYDRSKREYVLDRVDVNVVFGYPGLIDLARRTGSLVSITAKIVHQGDEWSYEYGSNQHLRHRPVGITEGRKAIFAYAFAKLTDGEAFEVLPYDEALAFRRYSQSWQTAAKQIEDSKKNKDDAWKAKSAMETPWIKHETQMVQKTMIRRLSTWLPKNIEFARAMTVEGLADAGKIDYGALAELPPAEAKEMLESGVVPEQQNESDDAPDARPEREEDKPRTRKTKATSASDTPAAQAARAKQTETVDPKSGEILDGKPKDDSVNEKAADDKPLAPDVNQLSEALEHGLTMITKMWDIEEIKGARESVKKVLSPEEFQVWQTASLEQERRIGKNAR